MRALLVEHDPHWIKILNHLLTSKGWFVDLETDIYDAFDRLLQHQYTCVVSDVLFPQRDDIRYILDTLRDRKINTRFVLVSGASSKDLLVIQNRFRNVVQAIFHKDNLPDQLSDFYAALMPPEGPQMADADVQHLEARYLALMQSLAELEQRYQEGAEDVGRIQRMRTKINEERLEIVLRLRDQLLSQGHTDAATAVTNATRSEHQGRVALEEAARRSGWAKIAEFVRSHKSDVLDIAANFSLKVLKGLAS